MRRAKLSAPIDFGHLAENTLVPGQVDSFWACCKNILSHDYFLRLSTKMNVTTVLSGYVDDASGEQNCVQSFKGIVTKRPQLDLPIEEADGRIIPHLGCREWCSIVSE